MSLTLRDLRPCFEGVIPSIIATVDADGMPNVSYLSQVFFVDERHVALSNQYFTKTLANIRRTGKATVVVVDGRTGGQHELDVSFRRSETTGELFDRMDAHLRALYFGSDLGKVMVLRSADIYEVTAVRSVFAPPATLGFPDPAPQPGRLELAASLAMTVAQEPDFDRQMDRVLDGLTRCFGFPHVMVLVTDEATRSLTTLASRGYEHVGVGAQVPCGQGAIGIAAQASQAVRICDMSRGRRYVSAVVGVPEEQGRVIPLPDIHEPNSLLAVPMIWQGQMRGVIFSESSQRFGFTHEDEAAVTLIASQLAAGLAALAEDELPEQPTTPELPVEKGEQGSFTLRYFDYDDSVFIDDAYVIKGLPGRLLYHFLCCHRDSGRRDFTNREIRLHADLKLPDLKDNLETRLILLRRRLEERDAPVRLERPGRGLIRLDLRGSPRIERVKDRP
ncbi:GAF domain-containing protein [Lacibacterium aquatile]|uniref:GAF domain-containing protein n=1 Tax=Lacibacterium aquatile TaxID=1168082 RepID=A0ABW5E0M6_9PROT